MLVLLMNVFLLDESGVYRQLTCHIYSLTMKTIEDKCRENINIMKAMSVIVNYGSFMFVTIELEDE